MFETIEFHQTMMVPARTDVLYRLVLDPSRRVQWDPNLRRAAYVDPQAQLKQNTVVKLKFTRRFLWLSAKVRFGHLQAPVRGGWESIHAVGPLEKLTQSWQFKSVPGGTELTMRIKGVVRYAWVKRPIERLLMNMLLGTLKGLQAHLDAPAAKKMEEKAKELQKRKKEERKAARKRGKSKSSKSSSKSKN